jgi:hypothetical protein
VHYLRVGGPSACPNWASKKDEIDPGTHTNFCSGYWPSLGRRPMIMNVTWCARSEQWNQISEIPKELEVRSVPAPFTYWLNIILCLIRKRVNHRAGSNTFCTSTRSGIVLQKLRVKDNTSNLPDTRYLRRSQRIECIKVVSLSSRPFCCCASDAPFLLLCTDCTLTGILIYGF